MKVKFIGEDALNVSIQSYEHSINLPPKEDVWKINDFLCYTQTPTMGLGVSALVKIDKGTVLLRDPVRSFDGPDASLIRKTTAYELYFVDRASYSLGDAQSPVHAALGPVSIINHDTSPNAKLRWLKTGEVNAYVELSSTVEIEAGEEVFISYHNIDEYEFS
jgi:hypothetical protein